MSSNISNRKYLLLLISVGFVLALVFPLKSLAQNIDLDAKTENDKKRYNLTFRVDYALGDPLRYNNRLQYQGERQIDNNNWEWVDEDIDLYVRLDKFSPEIEQLFLKFDFMFSVFEPLNIGLSYSITNHRLDYEGNLVDVNRGFFTVAGTIDYEYKVPVKANLYINPSITAGNFFSSINQQMRGTGSNFYYDLRLALMYRFFDRVSLRVWTNYDHMLYREKKQSEIYPDRERIEKIDFRFMKWGVGLAYRFFIYPD